MLFSSRVNTILLQDKLIQKLQQTELITKQAKEAPWDMATAKPLLP